MYYIHSFYMISMSFIMFCSAIILINNNSKFMMSWILIKILTSKIELLIFIDWMSMMFLSVVMLISSSVMTYSMLYMENSHKIHHFMKLIILFIMSMFIMVLSPHMVSILLGWDGLGLSSYCLIIFYQNKKSNISSMITLLMNRVGDIMILLSISMFMNTNSFTLMYPHSMIKSSLISFIMLIAMTKSAQIPFSTWLPMAMAAPTPVSSLVHSSTLVTAGVYLLIRFSHNIPPMLMNMLMIISTWTMILASTSALFEYDLKKIIALSTLSQLGLMILTISMKLTDFAFFHLTSHAMFKSLLFLCSGVIIHNYSEHQDIRYIAMICKNLPMTSMMFNTASLTLAGLPFLSGFYSKDLIIENFTMNPMNFYIFNLMYFSMILTMSYSMRLIFYISIKSMKITNYHPITLNNSMMNSLYILFLMSIFYGSTMNWLFFNTINKTFLPLLKKMLIFYLLIISFIMTMKMTPMWHSLSSIIMIFYAYFNYMWFMNLLLKMEAKKMFLLGNKISAMTDSGWIEHLEVSKLNYFLMQMNNFKKFNKMNFMLITTSVNYLLIMLSLY